MPDAVELTLREASRLAQAGAWREARDVLENALAAQPDATSLRGALVHCLLRLGNVDAALAAARQPTLLDDPTALAATLTDFGAAGAQDACVELLRARAVRHPHDYRAALALASALHGLGRPSEALPWAMRAHELHPHERQPIEMRAAALIDRGDVEAGLALYRELLARGDDRETAARHLVLMHYDPAQTNESLFAALRSFAERHLPASGRSFAARRERNPQGPLRIGWLSPRFAAGPVAVFLTGLLRTFDRSRHRHLLIALQPGGDAATAQLRGLADEWFDVAGLDDATLLQRLRALELDVLIDLAGHSTANRLAVVAERVAPLQVSWLDWFDTTAAPAMDAWISDAWLTPEDSTQRFTERVVRLPTGRFCYTPPDDAPSPTGGGNGPVVFASFNRLAKLNAEVLACWTAILERVPGSSLHLAARLLDDPATRAHTLERFAERGIPADRLRLSGQRPYASLLAAYRDVDIALDPFPFSGCTTTCDALYMGCAVVTWPGETFVSRQSASLLWRLGRKEWIARDRADYVERAVAAANAVATLRADRAALRETVVARLADAARHAHEFAEALAAVRDHA